MTLIDQTTCRIVGSVKLNFKQTSQAIESEAYQTQFCIRWLARLRNTEQFASSQEPTRHPLAGLMLRRSRHCKTTDYIHQTRIRPPRPVRQSPSQTAALGCFQLSSLHALVVRSLTVWLSQFAIFTTSIYPSCVRSIPFHAIIDALGSTSATHFKRRRTEGKSKLSTVANAQWYTQ